MTTSVPEWVCTEEAIKNDEAFYLHPVSCGFVLVQIELSVITLHYLIACVSLSKHMPP